MRLGAHLSTANGYEAMFAYARQVGAECFQIFAKSPRQWKAKTLSSDKALEFRSLYGDSEMGPVFTHTAYLINLSTDDQELRAKSTAALADELDRGAALGAAGVVTHVGNDPLDDSQAAALRAAEAIESALAACVVPHDTTRLLLENTAGAGRTYGSTFEQLGWILSALSPELRTRVGVCLDTCHAHAFGIDLSGPSAWDALMDEIDQSCGAGALGLIHANDCKFERGSRKDRHAWIGEGFLGQEAFQAMVCCDRLATVPAITEMPGEIPDKDSVNIDRLKNLRSTCR